MAKNVRILMLGAGYFFMTAIGYNYVYSRDTPDVILTNSSEIRLVNIAIDELLICQLFLLGFWVALSSFPLWARLYNLVIGSFIFGDVLKGQTWTYEYGPWPDALRLIALVTAAILLVTRSRLALERPVRPAAEGAGQRSRFAIRELMGVTCLVAIMLAFLRRFMADGGLSLAMTRYFILPTCIGFCSLWGALSASRTWSKCIGIIAVVPLAATIFELAIHGVPVPTHKAVVVFLWFFAQALLLVGSLLVVRSCGFRLVRK